MMARRFQLKLYDWDHGTLILTFPDAAIISGSNRRSLASEETLTFNLDVNHPDSSSLTPGEIFNLSDTVDGWERAYRVTNIKRVRNESSYHLEVVCEAIWYDLAHEIHQLSGNLVDQTPTTHLTQILTGSDWVVGTVTPTDFITVSYNYNTRLYDLQQLAEAASTEGARYELHFTAVAGGAKTVNLITLGGSPTASFEFTKNLKSLVEDIMIPAANTVYGIGGEGDDGVPANIGFATHRITDIVSDTITLDSRKVLSMSGDWTGFAVEKPDGTITEILSTTKPGSGNDELQLASVAGLAVDDYVRIVTNTTPPARVPYVYNYGARNLYGPREIVLKDEDASNVLNLLGPAEYSTLSAAYSSGLCGGWSILGLATTTEITNPIYVITGTKSQKVVIAEYTPTPNFDSVAATSLYGELNGAYSYKISHVTEGGEGPLSSASSTVNPANKTVTISITDDIVLDVVTHWRLYRTKAGGSTYYRIGDIPIDTLSFIDNIADENLTIEPPGTITAAGCMGVKRTFKTVAGEQYAAIVYGYVDSGSVRAQLRSGSYIFPPPSQENRGTTPVGSKTPFVIELEGFEAQGATSTIEIVAHDGPATFYVDSAIVVHSPYLPEKDKFVADNAMTELWYKCFDELQDKLGIDRQVTVSAIDLHELDNSGDEINVGDTISVDDSVLGTSLGVRITAKTFDIVSPWLAEFEAEYNANNVLPRRRFTDEYYNRRKRENDISRTLARKVTRLTGQMKSDIFSNKRAKVQISSIVE